MSFLTPLYLLGALAIGLPILAHLIRRTPPRRREFSSVAFLTPSEPKVTRRSRIENWPLLCLRALVIGLLALAFARPLWRTPAVAEQQAPDERRAAVLVDTSASMRRDGLWDEAQEQLGDVLNDYGPADHVGVFTFDTAPELVWNWDAWTAQPPAQRASAVSAVLEEVQPTWLETNLDAALIAAAERLESEAAREAGASLLEIVVISDLQSGSRLAQLVGYAWPENVAVKLVRLGQDLPPDNAGLQPASQHDGVQRVRVVNAADADVESFVLQWDDPRSDKASATGEANDSQSGGPSSINVVVPVGQSRIFAVPTAPLDVDGAVLVLTGDAHDFDNACYVTLERRESFTIAYLGSDAPGDPARHRFYVEPLFADTPQRDVTIVDWNRQSPMSFEADAPVRLVLLTDVPAEEQIGPLRDYVRDGGLLINVLTSPAAAAGLAALIDAQSIPAREADVDGFSLLRDIDFDHPALAQFADPRFSDFTTLHFWKHRRIDTSAMSQLRVLARFDDGDVAIGEIPLGDGRIVFFTSGWNRSDSELAVWSKFVPLMNGLLELTRNVAPDMTQLTVGDEIPWRAIRPPAETQLKLLKPDGTSVLLADDAAPVVASLPGLYTVADEDDQTPAVRIAANVPASESQTAPLAMDQLEAAGVAINSAGRAVAQSSTARPTLADSELEQQQQLWRWVLLAVVVLLLIETAWAGWLTRRSPAVGERMRGVQ